MNRAEALKQLAEGVDTDDILEMLETGMTLPILIDQALMLNEIYENAPCIIQANPNMSEEIH